MKVEDQVRQYVIDNFIFSEDGCELPDHASFLDANIIDSTGVLELVMFVEEVFGVSVQDDEIVRDNFDSVAQLAAYVSRKRSGERSG